MAETTTVFQSGTRQAVRLPKEFRLNSKTVRILRRGDEVVLRERPGTLGEVLASRSPITEEEAAQMDAVLDAIKEPLPPDTRDRSWLKEASAGVAAPAKWVSAVVEGRRKSR